MKFLGEKKEKGGIRAVECRYHYIRLTITAICIFLFITVRSVYGWEILAVPFNNDFGDVYVDFSSDPQAFKICNTGPRDLKIAHLSISDNTNFSLNLNNDANGCESLSPTIAAGKSCFVDITFNPVTVGIKKAVFQITSSDSDQSPLSADLFGRGVTNEDNEGDGLPDVWERQIVDADPNDQIRSVEDVKPDDDFDGDGVSNSKEFKNGTNPINSAENTPGLILQANSTAPEPDPTKPETYASKNVDHNDGFHGRYPQKTHAEYGFGKELVVAVVSDIYLNSLQVPVFALNFSKKYFWPKTFADSLGPISAQFIEQ